MRAIFAVTALLLLPALGSAQTLGAVEFSDFGFSAREAVFQWSTDLPGYRGITVITVAAGSAAQQGGLQAGDQIIAVNRRRIRGMGDFADCMDQVKSLGSFTLIAVRNNRRVNVTVRKLRLLTAMERDPVAEKIKTLPLSPFQVFLSLPVLSNPVTKGGESFVGLGLGLSRRIQDRISLSAILFSASEELRRERFSAWTSLNLGLRLDLRSALSPRIFNFFIRCGASFSYVHLRDSVAYASGGAGLSFMAGPEFRLGHSMSIGAFFGYDYQLYSHLGRRTDGVNPGQPVYNKHSYFGGLFLRIDAGLPGRTGREAGMDE